MDERDRVRAHTAEDVNRRIDQDARHRVLQAIGLSPADVARRIDALDDEWDIERWLQVNASLIALGGVLLGLLVHRRFLAIPCVVLAFLFQHAVHGWCPPLPLLRRFGVRTRREIDAEKYALKALRGDFDEIRSAARRVERPTRIMEAVEA